MAAGAPEVLGLDNFRWPPRGGEAELVSLQVQAAKRAVSLRERKFERPPDSWLSRLGDLCRRFPGPLHPARDASKPDPRIRKSVLRYTATDWADTMNSINRDGSPGLPLAHEFSSKGEALDQAGERILLLVRCRMNLLTRVTPALLMRLNSRDLVMYGLADPVRTFVKNEPHSAAKLAEGRTRLIFSISMVDEIIERLLCSDQNMAEIAQWDTIPSKPGMGLGTDEQAATLFADVERQCAPGEQFLSTDVSGWDWSVQGWMFAVDLGRRKFLWERGLPRALRGQTRWYSALSGRYRCLMNSVVVLSSGEAFAQATPGIMKSGSYLTSSTNSFTRVALADLAGARWAVAMGDDCLEALTEDTETRYAEYGFRLTDAAVCTLETGFEFCSHRFERSPLGVIARPLNVAKGLFRFLSHSTGLPELGAQFRREYRHALGAEAYLELARKHEAATTSGGNQ